MTDPTFSEEELNRQFFDWLTTSGTGNVGEAPPLVQISGSVSSAGSGTDHDAAAAAVDPTLIGGYASAAAPADVSADVDAVRAWFLRNGAQAIVLTAGGALIGGDATNGLDVDVTRTPAYGTVATGELAGSASAVQMPTVTCRLVRFKAHADNAGKVYIGGASVTKVDGTTDTTTGLQLSAGDDTGWLPVSNVNVFYRITDNAGDDLTYIALA